MVIDEAHCMKKWGEEFRPEFKRLGDLRSILPKHVNIMALTATATINLRVSVEKILNMRDPILIQRSPDKENVFLAVKVCPSIQEPFLSVASKLKELKTSMPRIIIFCKQRDHCSILYSFFKYHLRENFTNPPGASIHTPENRLVDMFHSGTQVEVKDKIIRYFKDPTSNLRIVIATIAFGLGIDCPNVRQVVHYGPPEDVESYVRHIGRAGRDNERSCSLLLHGPGLYRYTDEYLKDYCVKTDAEEIKYINILVVISMQVVIKVVCVVIFVWRNVNVVIVLLI